MNVPPRSRGSVGAQAERSYIARQVLLPAQSFIHTQALGGAVLVIAALVAGYSERPPDVNRSVSDRPVRCNALAPGFIRTDMTVELSEAQVAALRDQIPLGELGEAVDIAGAARFLVGPGARYITGQVLAVDGGMVM